MDDLDEIQARNRAAFAIGQLYGRQALIDRLAEYITPELADVRQDIALRYIARRILADLGGDRG